MVELVRINADNKDLYENFREPFEEDLNQYQSRICPKENAEKVNWYYIVLDNNILGSIWLEKEKEKPFAVLGIFIADTVCRGKGIGKQAIRLIIEKDAAGMGVEEIHLTVRANNERAYKCYSGLGFQEVSRYEEATGIPVVSMRLPVK